MNKKAKFKKWVKEHKAEIAVFTYGALATGVGVIVGYKFRGKVDDKIFKSFGEMMYVTNCEYTLADLGKVGADSLTVPSCPNYANKALKINKVMFFYDKP